MTRSDGERLADALLHLDHIERYSAMDMRESVVVDAIALRLAAMIESLSAVSASTIEEMFGVDWPAMKGLRNRIAHGYLTVDAVVLRITVRDELPHLRKIIERRLHS